MSRLGRRADGEQLAQVANPDPFAPPVWRSPVYRTPEPVIWAAQLARLLGRLVWFAVRHPGTDTVVAAGWLVWSRSGWPGLTAVITLTAVVLAVLRLVSPRWFARLVTNPARNRWRRLRYRRRWHAVLTVAGLAPVYEGRVLLPVLGRVTSTPYADTVPVGLVSGQSPDQFAGRADALAHGFGAASCRIRTGRPGTVVLEFIRRDSLASVIPALPVPAEPDLRALPVGRTEDGRVLTIRLSGTHLLIAGATGSGKGSYLWGLTRAMQPLLAAGLAQVWACDPKLMELAYGRAVFERHGRYAAGPADIAVLLEDAVTVMQERAARFAGRHRDHAPTTGDPFTVVMVDEIAFLTAYQADRKLRDRTLAALATLTTQGRAAGFSVVAALQDPRKEVLNIRNLFPDKIALRLDEPSQVDLVLGDGARDRGARCDQIPASPATGAGIGYLRTEASPDPVRVRSAWISDTDIRAMTTALTGNLPAVIPASGVVEAA